MFILDMKRMELYIRFLTGSPTIFVFLIGTQLRPGRAQFEFSYRLFNTEGSSGCDRTICTIAEVAVKTFDAIQPFAVIVTGRFIAKAGYTAQDFWRIPRASAMLINWFAAITPLLRISPARKHRHVR